LPPGAGVEITNCGSSYFLFTTDLNKFYRQKSKIIVAEEVFVNSYPFNPSTEVKKCNFIGISINYPEPVPDRTAIQIFSSTKPDPKELFPAPQQ
jgi:hypothetical protein